MAPALSDESNCAVSNAPMCLEKSHLSCGSKFWSFIINVGIKSSKYPNDQQFSLQTFISWLLIDFCSPFIPNVCILQWQGQTFCTCLEIYQKKLSTRRHSRRTRYPLKRACSSQFADRNAFTSASLFQGGVNPDANNLTEAVSVVLPVCVQSIFLDDSFHNKLCAITVCWQEKMLPNQIYRSSNYISANTTNHNHQPINQSVSQSVSGFSRSGVPYSIMSLFHQNVQFCISLVPFK